MASLKKFNGTTWDNAKVRKYGTDTDIFTTLPANIYADGNNATVGIVGNMQQAGTPTPDNPIMPQETGERTRNLFDKTQPTTVANKYLLSNGEESSSAAGWAVSAYIPVNGDYVTLSEVGGNTPSICAYDSNLQFVRGQNYAGTNTTTISISGCSYVRFSYVPSVQGNIAMLNYGATALLYEPYGCKLTISSANTTTPVYLGEVETTRQIRKLMFDGTENWRESSDTNIYIELSPNQGVAWKQVLSTHFTPSQIQTNGSLLWFVNANVDFDTVEECKSYLAAQYAVGTPVCVWYVLATPTTGVVNEPLRKIGDYADTVSGITIPTITGADSFDVLTTLKPSDVSLGYTGWHDASVKEWDGSQWR